MSNNLNNFWDDCLKEDNLSLNIFINPKKPKYSWLKLKKINNYSSKVSNLKILERINKNYKKIAENKASTNKKNILLKYLSAQKLKPKKVNYKTNRNYDYNSRNKSINNNSCLSSLELKLRKNLSECTFRPKIISYIKNKNLRKKLFNYSKFTMYERGQIFEMKKKEDKNKIYIQEKKKRNIKYSFRPKINKCPIFKRVLFNDSNNESLNFFYSRMNSARENKIYKNKKIPFGIINYEEIYNNDNNYFNENNLSYIYGYKEKNEKKLNKSFLVSKILNDKETELCKQNLHEALMNLQLNKDEL